MAQRADGLLALAYGPYGAPEPVDDNVVVGLGEIRSFDVSTNDIVNSDNPELWVSRIVTPPANGVASITPNTDQKSITYRG